MIYAKVLSQLLRKLPPTTLLYEERPPADKPAPPLTLALEVALIPAARGGVGDAERIPAEPAVLAAHGGPFDVGYGLPSGLPPFGDMRNVARLRRQSVEEQSQHE